MLRLVVFGRWSDRKGVHAIFFSDLIWPLSCLKSIRIRLGLCPVGMRSDICSLDAVREYVVSSFDNG